MLQRLGFQVMKVDNAQAALVAVAEADARHNGFDVVMLDWHMPDMDGLQAGLLMRDMPLHRPPRRMLVTGDGTEDTRSRANAADFGAVLLKPVNPSLLFDHLMRVLHPVLASGNSAERTGDRHLGAAVGETLSTRGGLRAGLEGLSGARILAVDDNEVNLQIARELLEDIGLQVDVALNGQEAVQRVRVTGYDLVLMDMQMPVMDGLEATRAIRSMPGRASLPIVAMTANAMNHDRDQCLAAGMNDFLAKPIDPELLLDLVLSCLGRDGRGRSAGLTGAFTAPASAGSGAPGGTVGALPARASLDRDSAAAEWADVPGLDAEAGLRRVLGKPDLYRRLLARFLADHAEAPRRIGQALRIGDLSRAREAVHSIKGVAANISAVDVEQAAASLEAALRSDRPQPEDELRRLVEAVSSLEWALRVRLNTGPVTRTSEPLDAPAFLSLARRLVNLLREGDAAAVELAAAHEPLLAGGLLAAAEPFTDSLRRFDFDHALVLLQQALQRSGEPGATER